MAKYSKAKYGNAIELAEDLMYYGYGFEKFSEYPVAETLVGLIGNEGARELWMETKERLGSEF